MPRSTPECGAQSSWCAAALQWPDTIARCRANPTIKLEIMNKSNHTIIMNLSLESCFLGGVESQKENHITDLSWVELFFWLDHVRVIHWHQVLKNQQLETCFNLKTWKNWVLPTKVAVLPVPDLGEVRSGKSPWVVGDFCKGRTSKYPYQNISKYNIYISYYIFIYVKAILWSH